MDISKRIELLESLVNNHTKTLAEIQDTLKKTQAMRHVTLPIEIDETAEFDVLKTLLNSPTWPAAVDPVLICGEDSNQDKQDRAEGILDIIIDVHLEKLSFLDFGCGEGHVVNHSLTQNPHKTVGYDIVQSEKWAEFRWVLQF